MERAAFCSPFMFIFTGKFTVLKKLIPPFLRRIDAYLLLNHPIVWISKIHIVLFYGLLTWSLSALSGFAIPIKLSQTQNLGLWYFLFTILAIVALCFWLYHYIIFNLEKKFGKRSWADEYKVFFLNLCCVFIFISFPISFTSIYNMRVANTVSDEEFIHDINTLNAAEAFVANNINNYEAIYDTVNHTTSYDLRKPATFDPYTPWAIKMDTNLHRGLMSNYAIGQVYKTSRSDEQVKELIRNYNGVWKKYGIQQYELMNEDSLLSRAKYLRTHSPMESSDFYNFHRNYFDTNEIEQIFNRVAEAKYRPLFIWKPEFLNFILYTCFYLSLLVMLFKMVPWKQFLLTVIAFIIIPILLFIISQLFRFTSSSRDDSYLISLILTLLVAIVFTGLGFLPARQFNPFKNICAQITYLALPMLPVIILLIWKELFYTSFNFDTYDYTVYDQMPLEAKSIYSAQLYQTQPHIYMQLVNDYWRAWFEKWIYIALYGGLGLFVVGFMPLMKHLFVKQLSLPRRS
jgi:hypothetical protein